MVTSRATRLYADIPVEVRLPTGDSSFSSRSASARETRRTGRVRNLNTTGLLVEYTNPLRVGESIGVEFPPTRERGRMVLLGEVAWADQKRAGVRVCGMMPHHRVRFEKLLTSLQGGQTLLG